MDDNGTFESDSIVSENGSNGNVPHSIPGNEEEEMPELVRDRVGQVEASYPILDSWEDRILQALGGLEATTMREAYLEAGRMQAEAVRGLASNKFLPPRRVSMVADYCGNFSDRFAALAIGGLHRVVSGLMFAHLGIAINLLKHVLPMMVGGYPMPQTTHPPPVRDGGVGNRLRHGNTTSSGAIGVLYEGSVETGNFSQHKDQVRYLNPGSPVELDARCGTIATLSSLGEHHQHPNLCEAITADTDQCAEDDTSWDMIDVAEQDGDHEGDMMADWDLLENV